MNHLFSIINNISDACIVVNSKGIIEIINTATEELLGFDKNSIVGKSINILMETKYHKIHNEYLKGFFNSPSPRKMGEGQTIFAKHKNGKALSVEISLSPVILQGEPYVLAIFAALGKVQEKIATLENQKKELLNILQNNEDHIFQIDRDFRITYTNKTNQNFIDNNILGTDIRTSWPKCASNDSIEEKFHTAFSKGNSFRYEMSFSNPSGRVNYLTVATPVIIEGSVKYINLVARDESYSAFLKGQMTSKNRFVERINEYSINGIYIYDITNGVNSYVNKRYSEILGYSLQEINDFDQEGFFNLFHPDDKERVIKHMASIISGSFDESYELTYRFKKKSGDWIWCHSVDTVFEVNDSGIPISFMGCFVDVSDFKKIELELLVKNKEIENFVFEASHDIRSPLININQCIEKAKLGSNGKYLPFLEMAEKSSNRLNRLVVSLLDLSLSNKEIVFEEIDLNEIIEDVKADLNFIIDEKQVQIEVEISNPIIGSKPGIYQIFQNLINNSIKYSRHGINPRIKIIQEDLLNHYLIHISDNGRGIDIKNKEKVFEIFSRGRSSEGVEGAGIGLANCKKIISNHGGDIWVEDSEGEGVVISFTLSKTLNK